MSAPPNHVEKNVLEGDPAMALRLLRVFGNSWDPVAIVEQRARALLPEYRVILCEGDAQTFQ